jgi:hypothetical protein
MKIWMHRYLRGSAYSSLTIDEELLKDVNTDLAHSYVIANNLSEAPQIESVEMLEKLLKERVYGDNGTNDYDILYKCFIEEDGTLGANAHYELLYDIVYDLITNYLGNKLFELDDSDTIDYVFEIEE